MKQFEAILRLRRDNDYNYEKVKDSFVPQDGEICLVDTARSGLRAVCGDGSTPFGQLEYIDSVFARGYYSENKFYQDAEFSVAIKESTNLIYINVPDNALYYFDGENYQSINYSLPTASAQLAGVMKLYSTTGYNEDGTMTQKAITDELNEKFEIELVADEELIIFTND
jgi:hypothetical protein